MSYETTLYAFEYFYHMDKANACIHCATVRFSPITFELANDLGELVPNLNTLELAEVRSHIDTYELDKGR